MEKKYPNSSHLQTKKADILTLGLINCVRVVVRMGVVWVYNVWRQLTVGLN